MVPSRLNIVERGMQICFIIKQVHVKSINMTIKQVTKGIQRIEDMDTFLFILLQFVLEKLF